MSVKFTEFKDGSRRIRASFWEARDLYHAEEIANEQCEGHESNVKRLRTLKSELKKVNPGFRKLTWDAVKRTRLCGWSDGATRVRKMSSKLADATSTMLPVSIERRIRYGDNGDDVCLDRLYGGQAEECFVEFHRTRGAVEPVVTIVSHYGGNCDKSGEQLFWNGAVALTLADRLEDAGYRTEIVLAHLTSHNAGWNAVDFIRVKKASDELNLSSIAGVACEASTFRSAGFLMTMASGGNFGKVCGGLGRSECLGDQRVRVNTALKKLNVLDRDGIVEIPSIYNQSKAEQILKEKLADYCK